MQRCSHQQFAIPHIKDYRKRLGQSGYRKKDVDTALAKARARWRGILRKVAKGERHLYRSTEERIAEAKRASGGKAKKSAPGDNTTVFLDYFDGVDTMCKELNTEAKRRNIPMRFASRGGRILHYRFAPPGEMHKVPPPPCNPDQQDDPIWHLQGTVYEHECIEQGCPQGSGQYIGQSGNALHRRNKDHARATKKGDAASPFVEHYDEYHTENGKRKPLRIKTRVLASGKTHVRRTISEALRIVEKKPDGNRKGEHVAQTLLYIGLNEEERDGYRKRVYQVK